MNEDEWQWLWLLLNTPLPISDTKTFNERGSRPGEADSFVLEPAQEC